MRQELALEHNVKRITLGTIVAASGFRKYDKPTRTVKMKTIAPLLAGALALALATGSALAACPTTTGSVKAQPHKGIAKDGTHAPLENGANSEVQKGAASTGTTTTNTNQTAQ